MLRVGGEPFLEPLNATTKIHMNDSDFHALTHAVQVCAHKVNDMQSAVSKLLQSTIIIDDVLSAFFLRLSKMAFVYSVWYQFEWITGRSRVVTWFKWQISYKIDTAWMPVSKPWGSFLWVQFKWPYPLFEQKRELWLMSQGFFDKKRPTVQTSLTFQS